MDQASNLRRIIRSTSEKQALAGASTGSAAAEGSGSPVVISITSGKGGVGKSNIVGNLAIALQWRGQRVLIMDADLGLANIDIIYNLKPTATIADVISGEKEISQIIVKGPENVSVIPASSGIEDLANLSEGHKANLLSEFDTLNQAYDVLLIDTGAGISSNVIYFNLAAQKRYVIVTPEPTSITDAYALMKVMHNRYGTEHFTILMNMVQSEREAMAVFRHLSDVSSRFLTNVVLSYAGHIPFDRHLGKAVLLRRPVICSHPETACSRGFAKLADTVLQQLHEHPLDGNIKFFLRKLVDRPV